VAIASVAAFSGLPREERHRHEIGSFATGRISATVVASGRPLRFHGQPSFGSSPGRRRRHALSEIYVRRMSCGVNEATPAATARSRRITATSSSASRRSPARPPRKARPNSAPAWHSCTFSHASGTTIVPKGTYTRRSLLFLPVRTTIASTAAGIRHGNFIA